MSQEEGMKRRAELNGTWRLTYGRQSRDCPLEPDQLKGSGWPTIEAQVPGNVELDLMAAGVLEDISVGSRIYDLRQLEGHDWWYCRRFSAPVWRVGERVELVFEGLDCFGTIWIDGKRVGEADNMLIPHCFDVTDLVESGGEAELVVRIRSAVLEGRKHHHSALEWVHPGKWESLAVRKAPHMYGWDIMPRAVGAGLWRDVYLEVLPPTRWRSVHWATHRVDADRGTARVLVDWEFETERVDIDDLKVRVILEREGREVYRREFATLSTHDRKVLELEEVALWWPRGYGDPALHRATVELIDGEGRVLDVHCCQVGVRTAECRWSEVTEPDAPGEFVFVVNGERIFAKGTNWVPLDALHSRDRLHVKAAVEMLVELNCNMVRCWGGNVYEDHVFFDLCDAHGLMVWQDFALACASYPQTDEFCAQVRREAEVIIPRLRNHPSLVLWAGNNENDQVFSWTGMEDIDPNGDRISRQVLAEVVRQLDPLRPYLPSSPYVSPEAFRRGGGMEPLPEVHLWGPRGYFKADFYTEVAAHFVSEIGYHGCPSRASLEQMLDPEHLWPWEGDDQWTTKSVRFHPRDESTTGRNGLMAKQIACLFGEVPTELDDFILASQITQAEAKKFFVEFWRRGKWQRTGILWWNLRDGWPIISDAVVDYYNRKKLAYQYIKRVQVDVCVMVGESVEGYHEVVVVNDTRLAQKVELVVRRGGSGEVLLETALEIDANGRANAGQIVESIRPEMWLIEWETGTGEVCGNHYLAGKPPVALTEYRGWLEKMGIEREG
jgi:beta-mannosidase